MQAQPPQCTSMWAQVCENVAPGGYELHIRKGPVAGSITDLFPPVVQAIIIESEEEINYMFAALGGQTSIHTQCFHFLRYFVKTHVSVCQKNSNGSKKKTMMDKDHSVNLISEAITLCTTQFSSYH